MLRLSVECRLGSSRDIEKDASPDIVQHEFQQMIDQGLQHIYGDIRVQLQIIRAEVYKMAVEASVTGRVSTSRVDRSIRDLETLLDG